MLWWELPVWQSLYSVRIRVVGFRVTQCRGCSAKCAKAAAAHRQEWILIRNSAAAFMPQ